MSRVYVAGAPIVTERLVLRAFVASDLAAAHDRQARPDVVRYQYEEALDLDGARAYLDRRMARVRLAEEGDGLNLAVVRRDSDELIGHVNLAYASAAHRAGEVGRREAHLVENEWVKGEWTDEVVCALLDREWRAAGLDGG